MLGLSVSWVDKEGLSGMGTKCHSFHFTWITPWDRTQKPPHPTWDDLIANKITKNRAKCQSTYVWPSWAFWKKGGSSSWKEFQCESAATQKPYLKQPSRPYIPVPSRKKKDTHKKKCKSLSSFPPPFQKLVEQNTSYWFFSSPSQLIWKIGTLFLFL